MNLLPALIFKERNLPGSAEKLQQSLQWLGIHFDESPHLGGKFGPYLQASSIYSIHSCRNQLMKSWIYY